VRRKDVVQNEGLVDASLERIVVIKCEADEEVLNLYLILINLELPN
jgi:hypothetical protein